VSERGTLGQRPLRVAVVGAGPAGVYATAHLVESPAGTLVDGRLQRLSRQSVEVDLFDRLPTPWGLVRGAVAPDHQERKQIAALFESIVGRAGVRFFGNVEVGRDLSVTDLQRWYDAVVVTTGAPDARRIGLEGEELPRVRTAADFVGWYAGHPDHALEVFDLSHERVVIIGMGNVALDAARMLTLPASVLELTDMSDQALAQLDRSRVREVVLLARRGPGAAAFSYGELEELLRLPSIDVCVEGPLDVDAASTPLPVLAKLKLDLLRTLPQAATVRAGGERSRIVLRFSAVPEAVRPFGDHVAVSLVGTEPGSGDRLEAGLVLMATGYRGRPVEGLPFDHVLGVVPHVDGCVSRDGAEQPGTYVAGWAKRGPVGVIGTNKVCARDTVRRLLLDADQGLLPTRETLPAGTVIEEVRGRTGQLVEIEHWRSIDRAEVRAGAASGRPRIKLTSVEGLLAVLGGAS